MQKLSFVHPKTHALLTEQNGLLQCTLSGESFKIKNGVPIFLSGNVEVEAHEERQDFMNTVKTFLRTWPKLYILLIFLISPVCFTGKSAKKFLKKYGPDSLVLNVGSGVHRPSPHSVNIDIFLYKEVDIVASADALPFATGTVDAVVCESLLEHVRDPKRMADEMFRVLKPGGEMYIVIPFVYPFHACPNDFYRWSSEGMKELLKTGEIVETGVRAGPSSGLTGQVATWAAILFSFGSEHLYNIFALVFAVLFAPLKFIDWIIGWYPTAIHGAGQFYAIARKR